MKREKAKGNQEKEAYRMANTDTVKTTGNSAEGSSEQSIDEVLKRLVDVEEAAGQMKDAVEARKKELSDAADARKAEFDRQLAAQMEERSRRLEERMEKEKQEELDGLLQKTKQELDGLQRKYDTEHEKITDKIVELIKGVKI